MGPWGLCNAWYLAKLSSSIISASAVQSVWNFAQSTAVSLPYTVQISNGLCYTETGYGRTRFGFKLRFGRLSYIAEPHTCSCGKYESGFVTADHHNKIFRFVCTGIKPIIFRAIISIKGIFGACFITFLLCCVTGKLAQVQLKQK